MAIPAKSRFIQDARPAQRAGLTLYVNRDSIACHWVRLVLTEKDVDGSRVEFITPGKPHADLIHLRGQTTVPTLADRDTVLYPAGIIAEYLDERYPHPRLSAIDPAVRARIRMALIRIEREILPLAQTILTGKGEHKTARKDLADILTECAPLFPARGWFMGNEYTIADCAWSALFKRINDLGLKLTPPVQHSIVAYAQRLFARPAFRACA